MTSLAQPEKFTPCEKEILSLLYRNGHKSLAQITVWCLPTPDPFSAFASLVASRLENEALILIFLQDLIRKEAIQQITHSMFVNNQEIITYYYHVIITPLNQTTKPNILIWN